MQQNRLNTRFNFGSAKPSKVVQFSVCINIQDFTGENCLDREAILLLLIIGNFPESVTSIAVSLVL